MRTTGGVVSNRGTVLRVYLRRPWWTSGGGEQLGVVTFPGAEALLPPALPEALVPYVTQWGADPVYKAAAVPSVYPKLSSFTYAVATDEGLWLDELPFSEGGASHRVNVARHDVLFDSTQDLWYADIAVNAQPAYQPIIRLALARYQPAAVTRLGDDMHLSRVVLADFAQLSPGRLASVVYDNARQVTVSLFGPTYEATAVGQGPGAAWVTLQRRNPSIGNELGWTTLQSRVPMQVAQGTGGPFWRRTLKLPADRTAVRFRLVIEQADTFQFEPGGSPTAGILTGHRLVHSDVIEL